MRESECFPGRRAGPRCYRSEQLEGEPGKLGDGQKECLQFVVRAFECIRARRALGLHSANTGHYCMGLLTELVSTAPLVHPERSFSDAIARVKCCVRGMIFARYTEEWFRLLQTPHLALLVQNHPHIRSKLQRPYLNRTLGPRRRLEALKQHLSFDIIR